ncbi:MAG: helix-turn-helix transcriptional regulator [Alkalimonas sp.]|nr:helix-turn-helix transcriptional regulator [Alkalimonas sp.]
MSTITKGMSDAAIAGELYSRLESRRKSMAFTQEDMAEKIGITPKSYRALETGKCRLTTFIATLRHLDMLENLDKMITPIGASPLDELYNTLPKTAMPQFKVGVRGQSRHPSSERSNGGHRVHVSKRNIDVSEGVNPILANRQKLVVKG